MAEKITQMEKALKMVRAEYGVALDSFQKKFDDLEAMKERLDAEEKAFLGEINKQDRVAEAVLEMIYKDAPENRLTPGEIVKDPHGKMEGRGGSWRFDGYEVITHRAYRYSRDAKFGVHPTGLTVNALFTRVNLKTGKPMTKPKSRWGGEEVEVLGRFAIRSSYDTGRQMLPRKTETEVKEQVRKNIAKDVADTLTPEQMQKALELAAKGKL